MDVNINKNTGKTVIRFSCDNRDDEVTVNETKAERHVTLHHRPAYRRPLPEFR